MTYTLYTDGGSRGNPGHAAIGGVLRDEHGTEVDRFSTYVGIQTNNEAEYAALIEGLRRAQTSAPTALHCFLDSELVVKQLNGEYRIKQEHLRELAMSVRTLTESLGEVTFSHVRREQNTEADALVNEALDEHLHAT